MNKINNFQQKVVKHLKDKGFNCIVQTKFPNIIAWRTFNDGEGHSLALNVQETIDGESKSKVLFPFYVSMVECKEDKLFSKKEKEAAKKILEEGRCNAFLVAYKNNKKLKFKEIELKDKITTKEIKKPIPSYLR